MSALGDRFAGVGGFVNISQNAKKVVFCCSFRAGGLKVVFEDEKLQINKEGRHCKFVEHVPQVAFHGPTAHKRGQEVLYVTERAVFRLGKNGLDLIETAPGIDLETDICLKMEFRPNITDLKKIPMECFEKD